MAPRVKLRSLNFKTRKFDRTENEDDRFRGGMTADAERKVLSARCTTSIYPVLNTYTYRIVAGIDRLAFQPPLLDRDDTRVSEIMKFRRCRSNARDDDRAIYRPPLISSDTFSVLSFRIAGRPSRFSDFFPSFSLFRFLSFLAARYTCRTPSNVRRQLNTRRSDVIFERY